MPAEKRHLSSRLGAMFPPPADRDAGTDLPRLATYRAAGLSQIDKPLYKPGETVWVRFWDLVARSLTARRCRPAGAGHTGLELVSPRGAVVAKRKIHLGKMVPGKTSAPPEASWWRYAARDEL